MAIDAKQLQAISYLGWNFGLHVLRSVNPARKKDPDQAELFRSYFLEDRITSFSQAEHEQLISFGTCINCGICLDNCRVMAMSKGKFLGPEHIAISSSRSQPEFFADADSIFRCAACGQCEPRCPESVPISAMTTHMRSIIGRVRPDSIPAVYAQYEENLRKSGLIYGNSKIEKVPCEGKPQAVLFMGCKESLIPERAERLMQIVRSLGIKFTTIDEVCCGGVPASLGFDSGHDLPKKLLESGAEMVITVCPHCNSVLKHDPELGRKMDIRHIVEVIADNPRDSLGLNSPVVFHDPCHLGRGSGVMDQPRKILRDGGADLREMNESGLDAPCCGAGGGLIFTDPDLAQAVAKSRIRDAKAAGAGMLVTECFSCKDVFQKAREEGDPQVSLLTDLVYYSINR